MNQLQSPTAFSRPQYTLGLVLVGLLPSTLQAQGSIDSWGRDDSNQVSHSPAGKSFIQVAGGGSHSAALMEDGSIFSWGSDGGLSGGQVSNTPTGTGYTFIAAGGDHSLALRANGTIESWGRDNWGQVFNTPTGGGYVQLAGGDGHSLALHGNGSITAWGHDTFGQVANTPAGTFIHVAAGFDFSLAVRSNGTIEAWGENFFGQVSGAPNVAGFIQVAGGYRHGLALRGNGSIVSWGDDTHGQVSDTPGGTGFIQVSGYGYHSLALHANGSVWAWGLDDGGALDFGQVTNAPVGQGYIQVSAGFWHSMGLRGVNPGNSICYGDGTGIPCPCLVNGNPGEGCGNSTAIGGARLLGAGNAYFTDDTFHLKVSGIPGARPGLCVKGSVLLNGGLGNPVGDGIFCSPAQIRSQVILSDGNGNLIMDSWRGQDFGAYPNAANVGGSTYYQWWYRDQTGSCTGSGFNFSNGWVVNWLP